MAALRTGHEAIVGLLLAHRADIHLVDKSNRSALDSIAIKGNKAVILLLLERGALISLLEPKAKRYVERL